MSRRTVELNDDMRDFLVNVLLLAADRYAADSKICLGDPNPGVRSLSLQFYRQERQARAFVDILYDAEAIALIGYHVTGGQVREWGEL